MKRIVAFINYPKWYQNDNIHIVDISVRIDTRIIAKKENGKIVKYDGTYKTDFLDIL